MSLQLLLVCFLASQVLPQTTAQRSYEFKSLITRPSEGQQLDKSYNDALRRRREFRGLVGRREGDPSEELILSMNRLYTLVEETPTILEESYNEIARVNANYSQDEATMKKAPGRYPYARPYDYNRVAELEMENWSDGNFVSASYMFAKIQGPETFKLNYIAAECPLHGNDNQDTRAQFWTMVMNSGSRLVVMMDSPDEVECQGHLPQSKEQPLLFEYRSIKVTLEKTQQEETYYLHEITISGLDRDGLEKNSIVNYVQRRFRDPSFELFNTFLYEVRQLRYKMTQEDSMAPLIVLCKDGVGWTGMFILADVALYRIDVDLAVHPSALIRRLRDQRQSFIPEFEQFKWILEFILHYYNWKQPGLLDPLN